MKTWYVIAWGHPEPTYVIAPSGRDKIESAHLAQLIRAQRQAEELPPGEGGATWHVLKVEIVE